MYNGHDENRLKTMLMFLACTVHAGGPCYLPRHLFIGG